ncbi:hypothetical protein [Hansschlegelia sp. KR7-227]|uniref:hypothetical protein n=1 Tax=Hansschlegelia sp. KR7-227 TaxID=3400914 RepID=UPI003C0AD237
MKTSIIRAALAAALLSVPAAAFANTAPYSDHMGGSAELAYAHGAAAASDKAGYGSDRRVRQTEPRRSEDGALRGRGSFMTRSDGGSRWDANDNQG